MARGPAPFSSDLSFPSVASRRWLVRALLTALLVCVSVVQISCGSQTTAMQSTSAQLKIGSPSPASAVPGSAGVQSTIFALRADGTEQTVAFSDPSLVPYFSDFHLRPLASASADLQFVATSDGTPFTYAGSPVTSIFQTCLVGSPGCTFQLEQLVGPHLYRPGANPGIVILSDTGRYLLYWRSNDPGSAPASSFVLWDTCLTASLGCSPNTVLVNDIPEVNYYNRGIPDGAPAITGDGQYVLLEHLGPPISNPQAAFLGQTCANQPSCTPADIPVSVDPNGNALKALGAEMSMDARYVVFANTIEFADANENGTYIYLRDTCIGAVGACTPTTTLLHTWPQLPTALAGASLDARYAVILTHSTYPDNAAYLLDTCAGAASCTPSVVQLTYGDPPTPLQFTDSSAVADVQHFVFSPDNSKVAFATGTSDLVPNDTNNLVDTFVMTTCIGSPSLCSRTIQRVSVTTEGAQSQYNSHPIRFSSDGKSLITSIGQVVTVP